MKLILDNINARDEQFFLLWRSHLILLTGYMASRMFII